jgi:hypothetical protein
MNGKSKQFALVLASFAVGAVLAGVLGNSQTRTRLVEEGKKLMQRST